MSPGDDDYELPPPGSILARYAALVTQGFQLDYALRLTPAQITAIHGHPLEEDGTVKQPDPPVKRAPIAPTYENKILKLQQLFAAGFIQEPEYHRAFAEITAKFAPPGEAAATQAKPAPKASRSAPPKVRPAQIKKR